MYKERCCGNCHWFGNEDVYGVGWCSNNEHESSCDQVCDKIVQFHLEISDNIMLIETDKLNKTERGDNGYGSSDKK